MGMLIDGEWTVRDFPRNEAGEFTRLPTTFRNQVDSQELEVGRYALYISHACPWAHRCVIVRALRGLEEAIPLYAVHWLMESDGWHFEKGPNVIPDPYETHFLREVYLRADSKFTGRITVPILWDRKTETVVNNESREIIRMLNTTFSPLASGESLAPESLRTDIDAALDEIYEPVNNGVYRSGFANQQSAYEKAVTALFSKLDELEARLAERRFLCGDTFTEADIALFTTLIRFDPVYVGHFKCNLRRIRDYPNLWRFTREVYQMEKVKPTVDFHHIKAHYYASHRKINPTGVVPKGPDILEALEAPV